MTEERSDPPEPRDDATPAPTGRDEAATPREASSESPAPEAPTPATLLSRLRRWPGGRAGRVVRWGGAAVAILLAVSMIATITIDLGRLFPRLRALAEQGASGYLDREVTIGRIGAYLAPGRFLVEDLKIGGLNPGDRPFLTADRIAVSISWLSLLNREVLVDAEMTDWQMLAESFPDGTQSFPAFVQRREAEVPAADVPPAAASDDTDEGRRFV